MKQIIMSPILSLIFDGTTANMIVPKHNKLYTLFLDTSRWDGTGDYGSTWYLLFLLLLHQCPWVSVTTFRYAEVATATAEDAEASQRTVGTEGARARLEH